MKVDLSKYKAFKVEIKEMSVKEARSIEEPYVTKSPFNYSFFWNQIYFVLPVYLDSTYKEKTSTIFSYKYYTKLEEKFEIDLPENIYINEGQFEIPYEYYSKAYIEFFDIEIINNEVNLELTPKIIEFELDSVGRLHIKKECLANYIYCMEKKFPTIKCNITVGGNITSEAQYELAEKYLSPYFVFLEKHSISELFVKPNSIAEELFNKINKEELDFFLPYFDKKEDVLTGNCSKLTGYGFFDGSFIFFNGILLYHHIFQKILLRIQEEFGEWEDKNTIKFDTLHYIENKTICAYNKSKESQQSKNLLHKLGRKYILEIFTYNNSKEEIKPYYERMMQGDIYKRRNLK